MGRGLSDLQKHILTLAIDKFEAGPQPSDRKPHPGSYSQHEVLYWGEILVAHYGFPPEPRHWRFTVKDGPVFSMHEIGPGRYRAARSAVSRAWRRLYDRGLVEWVGRCHGDPVGVSLTQLGITWARDLKELSVNKGT